MRRKTSFFKALISKDARERRRKEILEEKERKKKFNAQMEACALSSVWFAGSALVVMNGELLGGALALMASYGWWKLMYALSYKYGPLIHYQTLSFGGSQKGVFFGPRGGRFRMSADGKRRIYF